jgi:hypothetical protein
VIELKCFICSEHTNEKYLCQEHCKELYQMLINRTNIIEKPEFKHHCMICGEYQDRIIINYPTWFYICNKDVLEEWKVIDN